MPSGSCAKTAASSRRDRVESRMVGRTCREVDTGAPSLVQGVGGRVDHPGQRLDAFKLAHRRRGQDLLDRRPQAFVIDRPGKAPGEPHGRLLERHDLKAMAPLARRCQAALSHGEAAVNDEGGPTDDGHRAVDIFDPEPSDFRGAKPGGIGSRQRSAALQARDGFEKLHDLIGAEHNRQFAWFARVGICSGTVAWPSDAVEEPQSAEIWFSPGHEMPVDTR